MTQTLRTFRLEDGAGVDLTAAGWVLKGNRLYDSVKERREKFLPRNTVSSESG